MSGQGFSQHPTDVLIRELIHARRPAAEEEVAQIIERMATAPFDPRQRTVPVDEQAVSYLGQTLGARADSLTYHLIKRVVLEELWAPGTTADDYLAQLRRAVVAPQARLVVYARRGGSIAATITPTDDVVPAAQLGSQPQPHLLVVFSADRGIIVTGYQFSGLEKAGITREALWLK